MEKSIDIIKKIIKEDLPTISEEKINNISEKIVNEFSIQDVIKLSDDDFKNITGFNPLRLEENINDKNIIEKIEEIIAINKVLKIYVEPKNILENIILINDLKLSDESTKNILNKFN